MGFAGETSEQHNTFDIQIRSSGGNNNMSNKRSGENPEDISESENEGDNEASNIPTDIVKVLKKKDDEIEKAINTLRTRIRRLETGNARGGNSSVAAAPPKKPKKQLLSDEEAEIFRRNEDTEAKVDDAIKREDKITPTALTKKLVEILFTEDERKVSSRRKLGYWRLQYIKEKIMKKFSVTKEAEEDLWKQCKLGVTKMLLPVDPPPAADNEDDEEDADYESTDEEDNNNQDQQDE